MNEEEIRALKEAKEKAEADLAEANKKVDTLTATVAEKDRVIEVKNQDIIGARKQYKKLSEMTSEEKEALSAKELELQERQEKMEAETEAFRKEQAEIRQKEVDSRWENAIKKRVGDNAEHAETLRKNMKSFVDHDKAMTEDEIASLADRGLNLFGDAKPNPINQALNSSGGAPNGGGAGAGAGFAESEAGKGLADSLGLDLTPPAETK